jgi:hypothetical protein
VLLGGDVFKQACSERRRRCATTEGAIVNRHLAGEVAVLTPTLDVVLINFGIKTYWNVRVSRGATQPATLAFVCMLFELAANDARSRAVRNSAMLAFAEPPLALMTGMCGLAVAPKDS